MKIKTTGQLKKDLWKVFSKYIRLRDRNTCFTCGRVGEGSGIHAGHFVPKSVGGLELYFNEDNVHAQCYHCNINLWGNQYVYGKKLGKKADKLYKMKQLSTKWDTQEYLNKIDYYKTKLKEYE